MRLKYLFCFFLCALLAVPGWAGARQNRDDQPEVPPGAVYRFENEDGQTEISSSLSKEAIKQGYEIVSREGRVIRTVEPALTKEQRKEMQEQEEREQEESRQKERDKELLQLYAGPGDARRARDRQIEALEVNISYTRNSLQGLKEKLDREVSNAANYERRGDDVPQSVQDAIAHYQDRIDELEGEIEQYKSDIDEVRAEYKPIIERLKVIAPEGESEAADESAAPDAQLPPEPGS